DRKSLPPARRVLSQGAEWTVVLGRAAAVSRNHFQRHGSEHPPRSRAHGSGAAMRLWSVHPRYFDRQALTACWREGLLALAVIAEPGRGYSRHPQLRRFQQSIAPQPAIGKYLSAIVDEADARGYHFARE